MSLGGSIFTHNAIEFDYCIAESIASLCGVCDEVVVLDAQSTDSTVDLLNECTKKFDNLRVITGAKWDCAKNYDRLAILANEAKSHLNTDWHFMLQADEVLHECSYPYIRECIKQERGGFRSFFSRRFNLFGDLNHYLRFNLEQHKKPCSDAVIRLAKTFYPAVGDAESVGVDPAYLCHDSIDEIQIWHYGFVRRGSHLINKVIDMQSWFHGEGSQPDSRVVEFKNENKDFDWTRFKERSDLAKIECKHPRFSRKWAAERQKEKPALD